MRRRGLSGLVTWAGIGLVAVGAVVVLWATGSLQFVNPRLALAATASATVTPSPTVTGTPTAGTSEPGAPTAAPSKPGAQKATPTQKPQATVALPPLPEVTPPPGGEVYVLTPAPEAAGWAAEGDERANHFGDYNIYAGVYEGQVHVGAMQFDLAAVPPGAPIAYADLTLVGLTGEWLGSEGSWSVQILQPWLDEGWAKRSYSDLAAAGAAAAGLEPVLSIADVAADGANTFHFGPEALAALEQGALGGRISFRVVGPAAGADSLFSWDSGYGRESKGWKPVLRVAAGPAPDELPPTPTPVYIIVTSAPTPENIVTAAAMAAMATAQATTTGTPTPLPPNWVTPAIVVPTSTPGNEATAAWQAEEATARAMLTGTPTPLPPNAWTATPATTGLAEAVMVTNTPTPVNWATAIARAKAEATRFAAEGPATPTPRYIITATPRPGYRVVTSTPTAQNWATVEAARARATIAALTIGTYTPVPDRLVTATPLPLMIPENRLTPTATPQPTPRPQPVPAALRGKIAFKSDRLGETQIFAMDPNGGQVYLLTQSYPYDQAQRELALAPGGERWAAVQPDNRGIPQVYLVDPRYDLVRAVTQTTGWSYDAAWAPDDQKIAFVSTEAGNDEIYTIDVDGSGMQRLTWNTWEWDKHPAWSPDGTQIVFYSNRVTGRTQIWVMNADGTGQRNISNNSYNDWDPLWIR